MVAAWAPWLPEAFTGCSESIFQHTCTPSAAQQYEKNPTVGKFCSRVLYSWFSYFMFLSHWWHFFLNSDHSLFCLFIQWLLLFGNHTFWFLKDFGWRVNYKWLSWNIINIFLEILLSLIISSASAYSTCLRFWLDVYPSSYFDNDWYFSFDCLQSKDCLQFGVPTVLIQVGLLDSLRHWQTRNGGSHMLLF